MTSATTDGLLDYLGSLVARLETFALTLLPPDDRDDISMGREPDGCLTIDLEARLPMSPRSRAVDLALFERWAPVGRDRWERTDYSYELRHHELDYRRAFHRHDTAWFVGTHSVATHEHCESTMGVDVCAHYFGPPMPDAFAGFDQLYSLWLTDQQPDCSTLICLT